MRTTACVGVILVAVSVGIPGHAQTNNWISSPSGHWYDYSKWSLGVTPTNRHTIYITNDVSKTVTIDSFTSIVHPETMTISNLFLSAPVGATNTLDLSSAGTTRPLVILDSLSISAGGLLRLTNSALWVQGVITNVSTNAVPSVTNSAFSVDGTVMLASNSVLAVDSGMYVGLDTNESGIVLLNGGQLLVTNGGPTAIGINGSGQLTVSSGRFQTPSGFVFVGSGNNSQGAFTLAGGDFVSSGRLVVGMETGAAGIVSVTSGRLILTNSFLTLIGGDGSGELDLINGTNTIGPLEIAGNPSSRGTLTVAGGVLNLQSALLLGSSPGATGTVWLTGGQVAQTNFNLVSPKTNFYLTCIGSWGVGQITVSNGNWLGGAMVIGIHSNSYGTLNMEGGLVSLLSKLVLGNMSNATGEVHMNNGSLNVTNANGTALLLVGGATYVLPPSTNSSCSGGCPAFVGSGKGVFTQNGGTVTVDRLLLTNGANSIYSFSAGTLQSKATSVIDLETTVVFTPPTNFVIASTVTNPQTFVVGDGIQTATFRLLGGVHSFFNDLRIRTNAFLTGCGTITGSVLMEGTVLADCGGTLTFTGVVTNNGTLRAMNNTTLEFYGPVVNNGLIDAINGSANFHAGVINNGVILDANSDYDGDGLSNLQETLAGTDPTDSASVLRIISILPEGDDVRIAWSAVTNKSYLVQAATNSFDNSFTNAINLATVVVPSSPAIADTNYLDVGASINAESRFYRIKLVIPP